MSLSGYGPVKIKGFQIMILKEEDNEFAYGIWFSIIAVLYFTLNVLA